MFFNCRNVDGMFGKKEFDEFFLYVDVFSLMIYDFFNFLR